MRISPCIRAMLSRPEEILIHVDPRIYTPTLQSRPMLRLHPYAPVERSFAPMPPVPEPRRQSLGNVPLSARVETLLVSRLSADVQRPHPHAVGPEPAVAVALDTRHLPVVPVVFVPAHRQGVGGPCPYQLSLVLVVAQCGLVLREASPVGGHR